MDKIPNIITKNSPKWVEPPPKPIFKTTLDRQKYWEEEKRRWIEGYGDGYSHISGLHYYYLTVGHLKDGSDGTIIKPSYRDCDDWIINTLHDGFWNLKYHVLLSKRREIGATSLGSGLLPSYTMRMFPSSTFGMTSCDQDRIGKAYYDKTMVFLDEMDIDIKPRKDKGNETKQNIYMRLEWKANEEGSSVLRYSDLFAKETTATELAAKGFSGTRMRAAYFDEFPLHKRKRNLLSSSRSCFMKGADQSGFCFAAGTIEEGITPEQIAELQQLVQDSEYLNFKFLFAPAWWGLFMNENGESDEKKGVEWVMKEREKLDKLEDKSFLNAFIKNYPLNIEEIFELGGSSQWDEYAINNINKRAIEIPKENNPIHLHRLDDFQSSVKATPDKKGKVRILEHPKPNVKYILGVDGIMTSELSSSSTDASNYALCVMKGVDPSSELQFAPVALYTERPKSIEDANKIALSTLKYYNQYDNAKIIGELNAGGEGLLKMVQNSGLWSTVIYRKDLNKRGWVDTKKPWFYRVDQIKDWQYEAANIYFKKHSQQVKFMDIIDDARKKMGANADMLDAFMACLYGWGTGDIFGETQKKERISKMMICVGWDAENMKPIYEERIYKK
jgi:hypothetical protein